MKRFLCIFSALVIFFICSVVPLAVADDENHEEMIELSESDYQAYIENLLSAPVTFSVDLDKNNVSTKNYESTNTPKPSGAGSIGSSITSAIIDYGIEIIKDVINDSVIENNSSGLQIPDFRQQIGKCRIVYNSGLVEILTCSLTTYDTQIIGTFGEPTGQYKPHAILTFIRESSNRYTVTTICDDDAKKYCDSYSTTGVFSIGSYNVYSMGYSGHFFDYATQETITSPRVSFFAQRYNGLQFSDLAPTDEFDTTVLKIEYLNFGSSAKQGLPEINSGYQYKTLFNLFSQGYVYSSPTGGTPLQRSLYFSSVNSITNSYEDYIQMQDLKDTPTVEQKQSFTYLSELNSTNVYNENTVNNYDFLSYVDGKITTNSNFSGYWENNVTDITNNNVYNTYNYYWSSDPDPTEPPPTIPPTDPPEPTQSYPPATIPTEPVVTCPPVILPTETYYMPELNTETYALELPTIPPIENLPAEITSVSGLIAQQSADFITDFGLGHVYGVIAILSVAVYIMRGER